MLEKLSLELSLKQPEVVNLVCHIESWLVTGCSEHAVFHSLHFFPHIACKLDTTQVKQAVTGFEVFLQSKGPFTSTCYLFRFLVQQ